MRVWGGGRGKDVWEEGGTERTFVGARILVSRRISMFPSRFFVACQKFSTFQSSPQHPTQKKIHFLHLIFVGINTVFRIYHCRKSFLIWQYFFPFVRQSLRSLPDWKGRTGGVGEGGRGREVVSQWMDR